MTRLLSATAALSLTAVLLAAASLPAQGGKQQWGTVKGRIVWGGTDIPKPAKVKVTQDQAHCLGAGDLYDNVLEVNPKNRGLKCAVVWLAQPPGSEETPLPIHPSLKEVKPKPAVLDQPRCLFTPRAIAIREGQDVLVKNPAPVNHNIQWIGDERLGNKGGNVQIPEGKSFTIKNVKAQPRALILRCGQHPWMQGRLWAFSHPYFAVTDADGNFEIPLAPAGRYHLIVNQEHIGWRGGAKGKNGELITIKPGVTDLGELNMSR
jgi:hypothetical protein